MGAERYVVSCPHCGTRYTARSWHWLEALSPEGGAAALDLRQCAVPGCCQTLARVSEVAVALGRVGVAAANDVE